MKTNKKSEPTGKLEQMEERIKRNLENYMDVKIPEECYERIKIAVEQARQSKRNAVSD